MKHSSFSIAIVGGGLAGCEAAWQLAKRGHQVSLFEMRPTLKTEAHATEQLAELVCSNSLKSLEISNAHGLLKAEMEVLDSLIIKTAHLSSVPAGGALAVDRQLFSTLIEGELNSFENLTILRQEIKDIQKLAQDFDRVILAAGPLCSQSLSQSLSDLVGKERLFFFDAISPIIHAESIDMDHAYLASRYDKGDRDYLNCPLDRAAYEAFVEALVSADKVPFKSFEQIRHFEGCLPIEVLAERGTDTLAFGPLKPVGLPEPKTGQIAHAVLQLRKENQAGTLWNLVGCQTRLTQSEQRRVFGLFKALAKAEFARYGSMHRNSYLDSPGILSQNLEIKQQPGIFVAGQLSGVEGYAESAAMGLWVALAIACEAADQSMPLASPLTMIGSLARYVALGTGGNFQPMNANFGLLEPLTPSKRMRRQEKRLAMSKRSLAWLKDAKLDLI